MNTEDLLKKTDASLIRREQTANILLQNPLILKETIAIIRKKEKDLNLKALMAVEVLARNHFEVLHRFVPELVNSGKLYSDSSSRRCLAKIYMFSIESDLMHSSEFNLNSELKKQVLELSFLWLIDKEKTAVKVFSMQNIFQLRHEEPWVREELKGIIEKGLPKSSAGYRSRATKILRKL